MTARPCTLARQQQPTSGAAVVEKEQRRLIIGGARLVAKLEALGGGHDQHAATVRSKRLAIRAMDGDLLEAGLAQ